MASAAQQSPALLKFPLREFRHHAVDSRVGVYATEQALIGHYAESGLHGAVLDDETFLPERVWDPTNDGLQARIFSHSFLGDTYVFRDKSARLPALSPELRALSYKVACLIHALTGKNVHMEISEPGSYSHKHYDHGSDGLRFNTVTPLPTKERPSSGTAWVADGDLNESQIAELRANPFLDPAALGLTVAQAPANRLFLMRRGITSIASGPDAVRPDTLFHWSTGARYAILAA